MKTRMLDFLGVTAECDESVLIDKKEDIEKKRKESLQEQEQRNQQLILCITIGSKCFAWRGSKGSFPVRIPSRAGYCVACSPTPRLQYGSYSDSIALAMLTCSINQKIYLGEV